MFLLPILVGLLFSGCAVAGFAAGGILPVALAAAATLLALVSFGFARLVWKKISV